MKTCGIARTLDERDAPKTATRKLDFWSPSTVRWILQNPIYKALVIWKSTNPLTDEYDPIEIDMPQELIIVTPNIWEVAQKRITINIKLSRRNQKRSYLLSGFFRCGYCGGAMQGKYDNVNDRRYACANRGRPIYSERCPNYYKRINCDKAESIIWDWITRLLTDDEYLEEGIRELASRAEDEQQYKMARLKEIECLMEDTSNKIRRASEELLKHDNKLVLATLREELKKQTTYHNSILFDKNRIEAELSQSLASDQLQERVKAMARQVRDKLPKLDYQRKRELMNLLDVRIKFYCKDTRRWLEVSSSLPASDDEIEFSIL